MTQYASENGTVRDDAPGANDFGLVVRVIGAVVASLASEGLTGAAVPASAVQVGFVDSAGNLRAAHVFDLDTGGGTEWDIGVGLRISSGGGSIEAKGQQVMASSIPVVIASDQSAVAVTFTPATVGAEGNAWNAAAVGAGGTSTAIDCQYEAHVTVFGNTDTTTKITVQYSQDNATFYDGVTINAPVGNFAVNLNLGQRYVRLKSSAAATITATIAAKL